jgi:hypothetical protein
MQGFPTRTRSHAHIHMICMEALFSLHRLARKVTICLLQVKAPCCGSFYTCHNCHDEAMLLSNQCSIEMKGSSAENMGRYAVTCVQCKECGTEQDVSNVCISCGIQFANYFCADCKLYATPSSEGIFHCPQCKICRVGKGLGKSHFHCETCQACYTLDSKASHKCVERALESDCPVCMQYLFTSSEALFVGPQVQRAHFQLRF